MSKQVEKKNCLFQYYNGYKVVEDTDLITLQEAETLWNKYSDEVVRKLADGWEVQMCIWGDAKTPTDYHKTLKEVDYRDCVVEGSHIFRVTKERVI